MIRPPLPHSEACERNRGPILEILRDAFRDRRQVLEIGSGTGQHAVHFAVGLPQLAWQPTERAAHLAGLQARVAQEGPPNLRPAIELDVSQAAWPRPACASEAGWDAAFSANTLHIMSQQEVEHCFVGLGRALEREAVLALYGPFRYARRYTSESNARFDEMLQARDPASGIRDAEWVDELAAAQGFRLIADHPMPANNQLRIWRRNGA